jgi:predicted enzyme related to lactoylglutathione lyase
MNYIGVSSVNEYMQKVEKLGGEVVMGKHPVPGMGYFAVCLDTENNAFGIWETDPKAK